MQSTSPARSLRMLTDTLQRSHDLCPTRRRLLKRAFSLTSIRKQHAAPETASFHAADGRKPLIDRVRVVPASPSYFGGRPMVDDYVVRLRMLLQKYKHLPHSDRHRVNTWRSLEEFNATIPEGSHFTKRQYNDLIEPLQRLSTIHPEMMPPEVRGLIEEHRRAAGEKEGNRKLRFIDEWGRSLGVGRRKTSTAKAYLVPGDGHILVNGRPIVEYFGRIHDRESAMWPLMVTQRLSRYNVFGLVSGGGLTGQAEALTVAVAKALTVMEPYLTRVLSQSRALYRDPRQVERKKHGHVKARKMPAWVKR